MSTTPRSPNFTAAITRRDLMRSMGVAALALGALGVTACSSRETVSATAADAAAAAAVPSRSSTSTEHRHVRHPGGPDRVRHHPGAVDDHRVGPVHRRNVGVNQVAISMASKGMLGTMFPQFLDTPVVAGNDFVPNVEHILSLNPDVVIQWGDKGDDIVAPLRNAGPEGDPAQVRHAGGSRGLDPDLRRTAGQECRGRRVAREDGRRPARWSRRPATAHAAAAPRALYLYNAPEIKVGADNTHGLLIDLAGGRNVASGAGSGSSLGVTREQVLGWDPEVLILGNFEPTTPADVYADPKWASLSAVKNKRVYKAPIGGFSWDPPCNESNLMALGELGVLPGREPRTARAHPGDVPPLYAYDVTDADVDRILQMPANSVARAMTPSVLETATSSGRGGRRASWCRWSSPSGSSQSD